MDVRDQVRVVAALEEQVRTILAEHAGAVRDHADAREAAESFRRMVDGHLSALGARLPAVDRSEPGGPGWLPPLPPGPGAGQGAPAPLLGALAAWNGAFTHMALVYAVLHAAAHRAYDSEGEGNLADLAEQHLREYAAAAQEVHRMISDAVVAELDAAGSECRCQCPACSLGVCLCAAHGVVTVLKAWRETVPQPRGPGIGVHVPRSGSPAREAGLGAGDRVVAVDARPIPTEHDAPGLQAGVRGHAPGEPVSLGLLRRTGERSTVELRRPVTAAAG